MSHPLSSQSPYGRRTSESILAAAADNDNIIEYVAGASLSGHRIVVTDATGKAIYAQNNDLTHAHASFKLTLNAAVLNDTVRVQYAGRVDEPSWTWTPQSALYLTTNGQLSHTIPTGAGIFLRVVAIAETATRILLVQQSPIVLA